MKLRHRLGLWIAGSAVFFGEDHDIGSMALAPEDYDPQKWYSPSEGVRTTINELITYAYVLLLK